MALGVDVVADVAAGDELVVAVAVVRNPTWAE